jgi:hypothetical protein
MVYLKRLSISYSHVQNFFSLGREGKNGCHCKKSKILRDYEPPDQVRTDDTKNIGINEALNWGYSPELDGLVNAGKALIVFVVS